MLLMCVKSLAPNSTENMFYVHFIFLFVQFIVFFIPRDVQRDTCLNVMFEFQSHQMIVSVIVSSFSFYTTLFILFGLFKPDQPSLIWEGHINLFCVQWYSHSQQIYIMKCLFVAMYVTFWISFSSTCISVFCLSRTRRADYIFML